MTPPLTPKQFARQWAGKATSIALAMVIPGVIGIWADRWLGWSPMLTVVGFICGFGYGLWRLIALAKATPASPKLEPTTPEERPTSPAASRSDDDE